MSTANKGNSRIARASAAIAVHCDGVAKRHYDPMPVDGDRSDLDVLAQLLRRPAVLAAGMNLDVPNLSANSPADSRSLHDIVQDLPAG